MKIFLAHSSDFDFRKKLYEPLRGSSLNDEHDIHLPQEGGKEEITKEMIKNTDVFIVDVSMPSTGAGIETGWADVFGVPIIAMHEAGSRSSSSINKLTNHHIEYTNPQDMIQKLSSALKNL